MRTPHWALVSLLMGCDGGSEPEPDLIACNGTQCFSIEDFGDNMAAGLDGNVVGWSYVIYYNGQAEKWGEGGEWRTQNDPPQLNANIYDPFNMGSIGKSITAMGAVVALQQTSDGVDENIVDWLPARWSVGSGVDQITFRDLMTHESGFRTDGCTDSELQSVIAGGISNSDYGQGSYLNANFCLMRVLIPQIIGTAPASGDATETAEAYVDWIQQSVFTPAGLSQIDPYASDIPPLYYTFPEPGYNGINTATWFPTFAGASELELVGAGNWNPSPLDLAKLMWVFDHTEDIMSATLRNEIKNGELGMYAESVTGGTAYNHNGGLNFATSPYTETRMAGLRAVYYILPNDVVAVLTYNSVDYPSKMTDFPNTILTTAYEASWVTDSSEESVWSEIGF